MPTPFLFESYRPWYLRPLDLIRWWYTRGLLNIVFFSLFLIATIEDTFSLLVMLKAVLTLKPLHQDNSVVGRGIGIFVRLLWVMVGLASIGVGIAFAVVVVAIWIGLLPLGLWGLIRSLRG
jgi:hypothetical protein